MIHHMEDGDVAFSAVVVFETPNGATVAKRYGPYAAVNPATVQINRMRAHHTAKGANQVMRMRFVSGRVERSGYAWEPIDGTV